jgi:hypothetical protein
MQALDLVTNGPKALLTKTETVNIDGNQTVVSYPCDLDGNRVDAADALPIYRDRFTSKTFARVAENLPSGSAEMKAKATAILALNPVHFTSDDGSVKGYFVEAPDHNGREGKSAAPPAAA